MARDPQKILERDKKLRERFTHHRRKNPKWQFKYVIEEVAKEFFISEATVMKILKKPQPQEPAKVPSLFD